MTKNRVRKRTGARGEPLEVRALLSTITVTSRQDNTETDGEVTLREALIAANEDRSVDGSEAGSGTDTIVFAAALEGATIRLNEGQLAITSNVAITGLADRITIDAEQDSRIFVVRDADDVSLADLIFINGKAPKGGAIRSSVPVLSLTRTDFQSNSDDSGAGAVYVAESGSGSLSVHDSLFRLNDSNSGHAAIGVDGGEGVVVDVVITDTRFVSNRGQGIVGTLNAGEEPNADPSLQNNSSVTGSRFVNNTLRGGSGVPVLFTRSVSDTVFRGDYGVHGYFMLDGARVVESSRFEDGGIRLELPLAHTDPGVALVRDTDITGNLQFADCRDVEQPMTYRLDNVRLEGVNGGGFGVSSECYTAAVEIANSQISNTYRGVDVNGDLTLTGSKLHNNTVRSAYAGGSIVVTDSEITNNGQGLHSARDLTATNTTISQNGSGTTARGQMSLNHVTIVDNTLTQTAAVANYPPNDVDGLTVIRNSIIAGNLIRKESQFSQLDIGRPGQSALKAEMQIFNSLIGSNAGSDFDAAPPSSPDANGNIIGTADTPIDPRLGVVNDNGGTTATRALAPTSPARDAAAPDASITSDQIGRARTIGSAPDMGAFEFDPSIRQTPTLVMAWVRPEEYEYGDDLLLHVGLTDVPADGEAVSANIATEGIEGVDGAEVGEDFVDASTTLTFDATMSPTRLIRIPVIDDDIAEPHQRFRVTAAVNSGELTIETDSVTGTIDSEDRATVRSSGPYAVDEDAGSLVVSFTLEGEVDRSFDVRVSAGPGRLDFGDLDETLNFTGQDGQTIEVVVPINDDTEVEDEETFRLSVTDTLFEVFQADDAVITINSDDVGAYLDFDRLVVIGSDGRDVIAVSDDGENTTVSVNGNQQIFESADVRGVVVRGKDGNDTIAVDGLFQTTLDGGHGNDRITGSDGRNRILGGPGGDRIYGGAANDFVTGGDGPDTIYGRDGNDYISGNGGYDSLLGGAGSDALYGNLGHDTLKGGWGADTLQASYGHDLIVGDRGNDFIRPGNGNDTVHAGGGADIVETSLGDDEIFGDAGSDFIEDSSATIYGGKGNDDLTGGPILFGDEGDDDLHGDVAEPGVGASIVGGLGHDSIIGTGRSDTLIGGPGNDRLVGFGGDDLLQGDEDRDTLLGLFGNNTLIGGDHPDILVGSEGDDSLDGGRHKDVLFAGAGTDTLSGGGSSDLLNASSLRLSDDAVDRTLLTQILNAWRVPEPYADRIAAVSTILNNSAAAAGWDTQDSGTDIFETDPSPDWYHVDSDLDQFVLESGELFVELED